MATTRAGTVTATGHPARLDAGVPPVARSHTAAASPITRADLRRRPPRTGNRGPFTADTASAVRPTGRPSPWQVVGVVIGVIALGSIVTLALTLLGSTLLSASPAAADEPSYETSAQLLAASDVVVRGRVQGSAVVDDSPDGDTVETSVTVAAFAGNDPGATVLVHHPSGASAPGVDLEAGAEYVLALRLISPGTYVLVTTAQGAVPVEGDTLATSTVLDAEVLAELGIRAP